MLPDPRSGPAVEVRAPSAVPFDPRRFVRLLYSQNPFYVLSVCFMLHGTGLWFRDARGEFSPWPLMGLICGYVLMVAAAGFVIVRLWKVWNDARSIFLILLLLFVELSLTFDDVLVQQPATGRLLLMTGLLFSMAVSEFIFLGLPIRLPLLYRGPYHLLLALLFLYPLGLTSADAADRTVILWRIYLFSAVAGGALLTLLPAIRKGREYVAQNGTPWTWPLFPWVLFGFLTLCTGIRAYALSLSFDPVLGLSFADAMQMESAFGAYYLLPLLVAVAVLLLEIGIVERIAGCRRVALAIPLVCVWLSLPALDRNGAYSAFLQMFTRDVGAPFWLASVAAVVFYGYAWLRRVAAGEALFVTGLLAISVVGRSDLDSLVSPQTLPLALAAACAGAMGLWRRDSRRLFLAACFAALAVRHAFPLGTHGVYRTGLPLHLVGMAALLLGIVFQDEFARILRRAGTLALIVATLCAAALELPLPPTWPAWVNPAYLFGVMCVGIGYAWLVRDLFVVYAGASNTLVAGSAWAYQLAEYIRKATGWQGAGTFLLGLAWFALALFISAWKAGIPQRYLPRKPPEPVSDTA